MKRTYLLAAALATVLLNACVQTQQMAPETDIPTPEIPAEATEQAVKDTQDSAEQPTKHVCSGLLSCKLGLCPNGENYKKAQQAPEVTAKEEEKEEEKLEEPAEQAKEEDKQEKEEEEDDTPAMPSQEQIEAAQKLLNVQQDKPKPRKPRRKTKQNRVVEDEYIPAPTPTNDNTSGIPGRSGLRMGRFAPPEEAASRSDNEQPLPNAPERHGLRSPKLPKSLPMSIEGKTNH